MTSRRLLDPASKTLLDAADYLETHGHCKLAYGQGMARCAVGAIRATEADENVIAAASLRLARLLKVSFLPDWNDAPGRTADEVMAALRQAAIAG